MMLACVTDGTGTKAAVSGVSVAGKTGSAQVVSDGSQQAHGWFVGYVADDEHPLAIVVILENSGSGGGSAAPAAAKILKKAVTLGY
jgi:peptidoglycan glycosyltransferase